jgi:predicted peptidase
MKYVCILLLLPTASCRPNGPIAEPTVDEATDRHFATRSIHQDVGGGSVKEIRYRLFTPAAIGSTGHSEGDWPLLVWLHGIGEAGNDNYSHIRWLKLLFRNEKERGPFPCFVVAYQCPYDRPTWTDGPEAEKPMNSARAIIDHLLAAYPIDPDRIYLSGVSSGGTGCWEMLLRYPDLFAAAAPLASSGTMSTDLSSIAHVPIWAFHTRNDPGTPVRAVRSTVARLKQVGGIAYLSETAGFTHDCWTSAFVDFRCIDWLLAQRRGNQGPPPPLDNRAVRLRLARQSLAALGLQYYLAVPTLAIFVWWIFRRELRRKRKPSLNGRDVVAHESR